MSRRVALIPWLERAIYVSLLSLSRDAAPPVVTVRVAAVQVVDLLMRVYERTPIVDAPGLSLPVADGEWQVVWGGETDELNRRPDDRSLRRAVELTIVDDQGSSHRGEGLDNRDYYAHGQPVKAMAPGEVVMVVDGVPDNPPGHAGAYRLGNAVVVRHGDDLYAVYAMLQPGSIPVQPGDAVTIGQRLGACGNSGDARSPRVHAHVQDGPIIGKAWGLQPVFVDMVLEREGHRRHTHDVRLTKGDLVLEPG
jgi:hypothetical protein